MNQLLVRAELEDTPIIEGEQVTFVWKGANPPQLMGDFTDWELGEPLSLKKSGEDVWTKNIEFPLDAYLEYVFVRNGRRVLDPHNSRLTPNGLGQYNHYFCMPNYQPTTLTIPIKEELRGSITTQSLATWELIGGKKRTIHLYDPGVSHPTPLLVVLDGQDYLRRAHLPTIVDNLIIRGRIQPISLVLVENKKATRVVEYGCSEGNLTFLSEVVLTAAHEKLNLINPSELPGAYGILGASMGGLMALYTGLRQPDVFGKVLVQSGGYSLFNRDMVVFDIIQFSAKKSIKLWMEVGKYDNQQLLDSNRRMNDLLKVLGYDVAYREYNAGHNYPAWRDEIWQGLEYIFGTQ